MIALKPLNARSEGAVTATLQISGMVPNTIQKRKYANPPTADDRRRDRAKRLNAGSEGAVNATLPISSKVANTI